MAEKDASYSSFEVNRETSVISLDAIMGHGRVPSKNPSIVFLYPDIPLRGKLIKLETPEYVIGRSPECDLQIDRDAVSRRHARLFHSERKGWMIEDLNSTNGVYVNDSRTRSEKLEDGNTIRVGDAYFRFLTGDNVEAQYHEVSYRLAISDGLTGAHNRRHFDEFLEHEAALASRHGHALSLILLDIDHFKRINDRYGHLVGDVVLKDLTRLIRREIRIGDFLARFGGEEFAIILSHTDSSGALETAHKIRKLLREKPFILDPKEPERYYVQVSMGIATRTAGAPIIPDELIKRADDHLYQAKKTRDTIVGD